MQNKRPWHKLYSDFALTVIDYFLPKTEKCWEKILNPNPDFNDAIDYWSEKPAEYFGQKRNPFLEKFVKHIAEIKDNKQRFLSGVNIIPIVITSEGDLKTIRLCIPCKLESFRRMYFPWFNRYSADNSFNILQKQYQIAQYAMVDMSWEVFTGEQIRSLTGSIIQSGGARYIEDVRSHREQYTEEESIMPEVDDDVGFGSLIYIPILRDKLYLLIHSPIFNYFVDGVEDVLFKQLKTKLKSMLPLISLAYSSIQYWESRISLAL